MHFSLISQLRNAGQKRLILCVVENEFVGEGNSDSILTLLEPKISFGQGWAEAEQCSWAAS